MHENKIYYITYEEAKKIINTLSQKEDTHIVVLDGNKIKNWKEYITQIKKEFNLPYLEDNNYDGYADYMTDLDWLGKEAYALFIINYDEFMCKDIVKKKLVMDIFLNQVLFWWGKDVEIHCVGGKSKEFNVYLINDYHVKHR